jgi:hypothetical protein
MGRLGETADAVRARRRPILEAYTETRDSVLVGGIVDRRLKELCARYLAEDPDVVDFERSDRFDERAKAALAWAHAVAWDADKADDALWTRLHRHFTEPELVELGYAIAFMLGQAHWLRTLALEPEVPQAATS